MNGVEGQEVSKRDDLMPAPADEERSWEEDSESSLEMASWERGSSGEEVEDTLPSELEESDEGDWDEFDEDSDLFMDLSSEEEKEEEQEEECPLVRTRSGYVYDKRRGMERRRIMMDDFVEQRHGCLKKEKQGEEIEVDGD